MHVMSRPRTNHTTRTTLLVVWTHIGCPCQSRTRVEISTINPLKEKMKENGIRLDRFNFIDFQPLTYVTDSYKLGGKLSPPGTSNFLEQVPYQGLREY